MHAMNLLRADDDETSDFWLHSYIFANPNVGSLAVNKLFTGSMRSVDDHTYSSLGGSLTTWAYRPRRYPSIYALPYPRPSSACVRNISFLEIGMIMYCIEIGATRYERSADADLSSSSRERWNTAFWATKSSDPGVAILPQSTDKVAQVVNFARDRGIDLAVRCGGHSTDISASTDGGILIDLRRMNQVDVDMSNHTVTVQGGALWADVHRAIAEANLAVFVADTDDTSLRSTAWVADNLLSAQVVTGQGQVLTASAEENQDLFWGIRGAGANLGIVTSMTFQAYPSRPLVWSGIRTFACQHLCEVIQSLNHVMRHPRGKAAAQCVLGVSLETRQPVISAVLFFDGTEEEAERHFGSLLEVPSLASDIAMRSLAEANSLLDPMMPPGGRKKLLGLQFAPVVQPETVRKVMEALATQIKAEPEMAHSVIDIDFIDPEVLSRVPITETAFPQRTKHLQASMLLQWSSAGKDDEILAWGESVQQLCREEMRRIGHEPDELVSNFVGYTKEAGKTAKEMYGLNAARLVEVKKKYDPENVFNKLNPIS
ncbi:FAD-binding oxidoreductase [Aspergillus thermomutatus]|uniref:FAD-binding PCMH-type domain-containing protein n=1 Tax=Aspergillus thermomutatus TaxID=41047 RepID=A0A397GI22_ASPTH|nr:uncharacterized protein CDV56_105477 [Aspergillus thermomutatus]RHZ50602.1 hypothetical protein CDV56_105477 [Aspergillus thermomutatus]